MYPLHTIGHTVYFVPVAMADTSLMMKLFIVRCMY